MRKVAQQNQCPDCKLTVAASKLKVGQLRCTEKLTETFRRPWAMEAEH